MQFQPQAPFEISKDESGAQHAVKNGLAITVTPDVDAVINHQCAMQPETGNAARWLHVQASDLHVYADGHHVVITGATRRPSFEPSTPEAWIAKALRYLRIEKDAEGRYIINTESNRKILRQLHDELAQTQKNKFLAQARHALAKLCE